jgi:hypothetical protein
MHNHIFRLADVATIVQSATGKTIADGDADGKYDAEVVILHDADLQDLEANGVAANTVYFGDLTIHSYDASSVELILNVNSVRAISVSAASLLLPIGNHYPCIMFDEVGVTDGCFVSFYGWKITLNA